MRKFAPFNFSAGLVPENLRVAKIEGNKVYTTLLRTLLLKIGTLMGTVSRVGGQLPHF